MKSGEIYWHKVGDKPVRKLVVIERYDYLVDGRISNWVDFRYVMSNGSVSKRVHGNYFNAAGSCFTRAKGFRLVQRVEFPKVHKKRKRKLKGEYTA